MKTKEAKIFLYKEDNEKIEKLQKSLDKRNLMLQSKKNMNLFMIKRLKLL